ncbi:hypothetical protein [uncultured Massilia sp.]|uniref:hypothetical protein n=1 Tax=uncultured Massilia sp. TaxID=169973 RepID=UPI0025863549|nr:hypothetical protein [uncultured Massilia sp.]
MSTSAHPNPVFHPMPPALFDMWSNVAGAYGEAMQANTQQLLLSSARVIQEQILQAFFAFSASCAEALAKNAMSVQEQSMKRLAEANGKAVGMVGQGLVRAWVDSMQTATRS